MTGKIVEARIVAIRRTPSAQGLSGESENDRLKGSAFPSSLVFRIWERRLPCRE